MPMKKLTQPSSKTHGMMYQIALTLLLLIAGVFKVDAQSSVACPQNIDFSFGNFNNWTCYTSTVSTGPVFAPWVNTGPLGGTPPCSSPASTAHHVLTTGTGLDCHGGFPEVAPGGGLFSLRLGNDD